MAAATFTMTPLGAFDLALESSGFGGWATFAADPGAVAMTFPVEGWDGSATVVVRQPTPASITGEVHGADGAVMAARAWQQALAVLSLDVDGRQFDTAIADDRVVAGLHARYGPLRPVLFHSPYEAACNFVIGQRISMAQARATRLRLASESGDHVDVDGADTAAFPRPQVLLALDEIRGLPAEKVRRLHAVAQAALDGLLTRDRLRAMDPAAALDGLRAIHGVGPFSAQGILYRGAGLVDEITDDDVSKEAVQRCYGLDHRPDQQELLRLAELWRPFRMWVLVLLHVWLRRDGGGPTPPARPARRVPSQ